MNAGPKAPASPLLDYAVALRAHPDETACGDAYAVEPCPHGVLVAVIDGLGHGPEAAAASHLATEVLRAAADGDLIDVMGRCHEALRRTRGAAMTLARIDPVESTIGWVGVGNVEGVLVRADAAAKPPRESLLLRGGVVGFRMPPLRRQTRPIARGDVLVLASDGVAGSFGGSEISDDVDETAKRILARHDKGTDDALVLVARYLGSGP